MMFFRKKQNLLKTLLVVLFLGVLCVAPTHFAHAFLGVDVYAGLKTWINEYLLILANGILSTGAFILGIAGVMLEETLKYTVVGMRDLIAPNSSLGGVITTTWTAFRDVANMFFIFILLYAAIGKILDLGGVNTNKILRNVILVAIFLNFSLFFTKIIIDGSNILTINFYNKISSASQVDPNSLAGKSGAGISNAFMTQFGITSFYNPDNATAVFQPNNGLVGGQMMKLAIYGFIFMLFASFVFFAMAVLFVIRFVRLIFILILSPLAFAAMALPKDKYSSMWWSSLWDEVIFAPVCMALMWVVLQILTGIGKTVALVDIVNGKSTAAESGVTIMNFVIAIIFMIAVLIVAKRLGATGSSTLLKTGKKWRQNAQGFIGRNTAGWAGARADKYLAGTRIGNTQIGRAIRGETTGALKNAGFGSKTSFSKAEKQREKDDTEYANLLQDRRDKRNKAEAEKRLKEEETENGLRLRKTAVTTSESRITEINKQIADHQSQIDGGKASPAEQNDYRGMIDELKKMRDVEAKKKVEAEGRAEASRVANKVRTEGVETLTKEEKKTYDKLKTTIEGEVKKEFKDNDDAEIARFEKKGGVALGASIGGVIGTVGGPAGTVIGATAGAVIQKALTKWGGKNFANISRAVSSAAAGAATGAVVGSMAPVVGTITGAVVGGIGGGVAGFNTRNTLSKQNKVIVEVLRSGKKKGTKKKINKETAEELGLEWDAGDSEKDKGEGDEGEKKGSDGDKK